MKVWPLPTSTSRTCVAAVVPKSQSAADVSNANATAQAATSVCTATGGTPAGPKQ